MTTDQIIAVIAPIFGVYVAGYFSGLIVTTFKRLMEKIS